MHNVRHSISLSRAGSRALFVEATASVSARMAFAHASHMQVYDAFERYLTALKLTHCFQQVQPAAGYQGLGNQEAVYEDGYRLYTIQHAKSI
jgi:hypothetical protein